MGVFLVPAYSLVFCFLPPDKPSVGFMPFFAHQILHKLTAGALRRLSWRAVSFELIACIGVVAFRIGGGVGIGRG